MGDMHRHADFSHVVQVAIGGIPAGCAAIANRTRLHCEARLCLWVPMLRHSSVRRARQATRTQILSRRVGFKRLSPKDVHLSSNSRCPRSRAGQTKCAKHNRIFQAAGQGRELNGTTWLVCTKLGDIVRPVVCSTLVSPSAGKHFGRHGMPPYSQEPGRCDFRLGSWRGVATCNLLDDCWSKFNVRALARRWRRLDVAQSGTAHKTQTITDDAQQLEGACDPSVVTDVLWVGCLKIIVIAGDTLGRPGFVTTNPKYYRRLMPSSVPRFRPPL